MAGTRRTEDATVEHLVAKGLEQAATYTRIDVATGYHEILAAVAAEPDGHPTH